MEKPKKPQRVRVIPGQRITEEDKALLRQQNEEASRKAREMARNQLVADQRAGIKSGLAGGVDEAAKSVAERLKGAGMKDEPKETNG